MTGIPRQLLILGTIMFLLGLLLGFAVPKLRNPRMGVSVHLTGVQSALVLWAVGLMWQYLHLSAGLLSTAAVLLALGLYSNWTALLLSSIWGTSRNTPIAGAGHHASKPKEGVVTALLATGSIEIVLGAAALLWGLVA